MPASITVYVVDKDESVLRAMARLMKAVGFQAVCVSSIEGLLHEELGFNRVVLLVDVSTARQFEASLHEQLHARGLTMPIIYLTDCDTDRMRRELRSQGAAGYFRKPVDQQALVDAITFATQQPNGTEAVREIRH
jgi:FixJ family two-component response regulator